MIEPAPLQPSLTVTPLNTFGTAAWQLLSALALVGAGQLTVGGVLSVTVIVVLHVALLPAPSVAVTVMACVPNPTIVPATGDWLKVISPALAQPPLTVTPLRTLGTAARQLPSALALGTVGQFTVGGTKLPTSIVVEQVTRHPLGSDTDTVS